MKKNICMLLLNDNGNVKTCNNCYDFFIDRDRCKYRRVINIKRIVNKKYIVRWEEQQI